MKQENKKAVWETMKIMEDSKIDLEIFYIATKTNLNYKSVEKYINKFRKHTEK